MFYVLSGQTDTMTPDEGKRATRKLAAMLRLHGLKPRYALGVFEGKTEHSLVVPVCELEHHSVIFSHAEHFGQRYVLAVDAHNLATLIACDPSRESEELGYWVCKGNEVPEGDYTYVAGLYYVCE